MQGRNPETLVSKWAREIDDYDARMRDWTKRSGKIIDRYSDERSGELETRQSRFNALWANVQTLMPALYARLPKAEVERRYLDDDDAGRVASECLQRTLQYTLGENETNQVFRQVVMDYLLTARGTAWVRYVPQFEPETDAKPYQEGEFITQDDDANTQAIAWEEVRIEYVHWRDFGHTDGRVWSEVGAVWKRVFMDREELTERFPEYAESIPLNYGMEKEDSWGNKSIDKDAPKKAVIYEIWDKDSASVIWVCKDFDKVLDSKRDPLGLFGFFPCPRPLYATLTNESLIPTPDYILYQDQALELDDLSQRITRLNRALKVAGVYDKACDGVQRILNEGVENELIAVDSWALFSEKGGLKGAVDWMPIGEVMDVRNGLEQAFQSCKARMDEITGINDLRRGLGNASETATAQQIKANYSGIRLQDRQKEVQRFIRDCVEIAGQIVCAFFDMDTLKTVTGLSLFRTPQLQAYYKNLLNQARAQGATPDQIQQVIENMGVSVETAQFMFDNPSWDQVMAVFKDTGKRTFSIDIETDSTILADETQEKQNRLEFLAAVSNGLEKLIPLGKETPSLAPLIGQMFLYGVRGFRVGRPLEGAIEKTIQDLEKQAQIPQPPKPDPAVQKVQAQGQATLEQMKAQAVLDQQKLQMEISAEQAKQQAQMQHTAQQNAVEAQRTQQEMRLTAELEQLKAQYQADLARLDAQLKAQEAEANAMREMMRASMQHPMAGGMMDHD